MDISAAEGLPLPRRYRLSSGRTPRGEGYSGHLLVARDGEAWRCQWHRACDNGRVHELSGVAFRIGNVVFASRSRNVQGYPSAGVVVYRIQENGGLPARWYHPDLQGKLGEGLSTDGPKGNLAGTYRAEYSSSTEAFDPLVKELTRVGDCYHFTWRTSQEVLYEGVGLRFDDILVAAWATPRESIEVVRYDTDESSRMVQGVWASRRDSLLGLGGEVGETSSVE